jgi:hypothetical protein
MNCLRSVRRLMAGTLALLRAAEASAQARYAQALPTSPPIRGQLHPATTALAACCSRPAVPRTTPRCRVRSSFCCEPGSPVVATRPRWVSQRVMVSFLCESAIRTHHLESIPMSGDGLLERPDQTSRRRAHLPRARYASSGDACENQSLDGGGRGGRRCLAARCGGGLWWGWRRELRTGDDRSGCAADRSRRSGRRRGRSAGDRRDRADWRPEHDR